MALVHWDARAHDRPGPGFIPGPGRPLHLSVTDRLVYHADLGRLDGLLQMALAPIGSGRSRVGCDYRARTVQLRADRVLAGQRSSLAPRSRPQPLGLHRSRKPWLYAVAKRRTQRGQGRIRKGHSTQTELCAGPE